MSIDRAHASPADTPEIRGARAQPRRTADDDRRVAGRARTWFLAAIAMVALAAAGAAILALRNLRAAPAVSAPPVRLALSLPDDLAIGAAHDYPFGLSVAPDGRRLVFPAARNALVQLWLHDLTTGAVQLLPGTDDGVLPFWSPDGRAIGFFSRGRLRALTLENAAVTDLAAAATPRGGAWHPGGDIIFAPDAEGGLARRRGSDGRVESFTTVDRAAGESGHRHPTFQDGGRLIVFFVSATEPARQGIWIAATSDPSQRKRLTGTEGHGVVAGDRIVYASDGSLVAARVDFATRSVAGRPVLLGAPVGVGPHNQLFAAIGGDVLVYGAPASGLRELRWSDRSGATIGQVGEPLQAWDLRISPSGATVAVAGLDLQLGTLDVWTFEGDRPLPRRISPAIDADESPVWSRDGSRLAWVTGRRSLAVRGALAALPEQVIRTFEHPVRVTDWSPDAQWLVVNESRPATHDDLWLVPADGQSEPRAYAQSPFNEVQGVVSPDAKWMAYASNESGRFEIYVDSFPTPGTRARLTSGGGVEPRWKGDGAEVYFRRGSEIHMVSPAWSGSVPIAAASERLFDARADVRSYDVTADGVRFLLNVPAAGAERHAISAIVNWPGVVGLSDAETRRP